MEFGFNFNVGSVRVKPALRAALDIHEYSSLVGWKEIRYDQALVPTLPPDTYWVVNELLINYLEPSGGITLGFDFANSEHVSAEMIIDADAAFRLYRKQSDADPIHSTWYYGLTSTSIPQFPLTVAAAEKYDATIPLDLRITSAPRFVYTGDISPKLTLGVKVEAGIGFDILNISQSSTVIVHDYDYKVSRFSITPDFSIGASFHLIPDHFSLHAGLGLKLFSFQQTKTEITEDSIALPDVTSKVMELPSARFAAGITLNLTEAVAMDLMAITSGISIDATKFTMLLTVKH
jgi:hypothetical protein